MGKSEFYRGGGVSRETNISLGLPKKGIVCRFKGSLARKRGGCFFEGG